MTERIVLLTQENREEFLPCIMPRLHSKLDDPVLFGFGIYTCEWRKPEEAAGAILCEYDAGIVTVLSIGVLPQFRRMGLGSMLLHYVTTACAMQHYMELTASCWVGHDGPDPIEQFFTDNGFAVLPGGVRYAVKIGDVQGSGLERHINQVQGKRSSSLVAVAEVSKVFLEMFVRDFDLSMDIFEAVDPATSCMTVVNGHVTSAVLLSELRDGVVDVVYMCTTQNGAQAVAASLLTALGQLYRAAPMDTVVVFAPTSDVMMRLAQRLLEGCRIETLHERLLYRSLLPMWDDDKGEQRDNNELERPITVVLSQDIAEGVVTP